MDAPHVIVLLGGLLLIGAMGADIFATLVVPQAPSRLRRLAPRLVEGVWRAWRWGARPIRDADRRQRVLGLYGPLAVLLLTALWAGGLPVGYSLVLLALPAQVRPPLTSPGTALYLSGTALLTLGVGDSATGGAARAVVRAEAASGLGLAALVVTWLFTLQSAFRQREALVLTLAARIGLPPAGATLLERYAHLGLLDTLPQDIAAWEARLAEVQESHLAYPILAHVRSRQPVSWIGALGALLDAATLVLTTVDTSATPGLRGSAQLLSDAADPLVQGLRRDFALPPDEAPGPTRAEFEATRRRLGAAGLPLTDGEGAWAAFRAQRVAYAGVLAALARYCALPPDRT